MDFDFAIAVRQKADIGELAKVMPSSLYDWTKGDIDFLTDMLRNYREVKRQSKKAQFRIGDRVAFEVSRRKYGGAVTAIGTISKINPKTIQVMTDSHGRWRVAADLLTPYFPPAATAPEDRELQVIGAEDVTEVDTEDLIGGIDPQAEKHFH